MFKKNVRKANYEEPWPCLPKHPTGTGDPGRSSVWPQKAASIHRKEQPGHSTGGASSRSSHLSPLSPFLKVGLERWMPQLLPSNAVKVTRSCGFPPGGAPTTLRLRCGVRLKAQPLHLPSMRHWTQHHHDRQHKASDCDGRTQGRGTRGLDRIRSSFEINMTSNMWRFP